MENADKIHKVYLGLGTNLGDRVVNIKTALEKLTAQVGEIISLSPMYETEPIGFVSENHFLNAVCLLQTSLDPSSLIEATQQIEQEMGRIQKSKNYEYSDRIIDIDLLFYDNLILQSPNLTLPHPFIQKRNFVLFPLADIAPELFHPVLKKTITEIKKEYKEQNP